MQGKDTERLAGTGGGGECGLRFESGAVKRLRNNGSRLPAQPGTYLVEEVEPLAEREKKS